MLSSPDNELLTRVVGTPMGDVMRGYWLPVHMSADVQAGGAPLRTRVLGENLVVFRGSDGEVGVLDESCPHRGASLALARNEDCALQCLYHGWRINKSGTVVDTPSEPGDSTFKTRIKHIAYPTREAGGIIWSYLGPVDEMPEFPYFEFASRPAAQSCTIRLLQRCNWAQALEGVLDSAHVNYLHNDYPARLAHGGDPFTGGGASLLTQIKTDGHPRLEVENTPYGFRYAAIRNAHRHGERVRYVRTSHFVAPFWGLIPTRPGWLFQQGFVPVDDEHTMFYLVHYRRGDPIGEGEATAIREWTGLTPVAGDYSLSERSRANNWGQDRAAMTNGTSYTGLFGFAAAEDVTIQESMGPIYDRTREHLGTSDVAVIRMRRLMIKAARERVASLALRGGFDYEDLKAQEAIIGWDDPWTSVGQWQHASQPL